MDPDPDPAPQTLRTRSQQVRLQRSRHPGALQGVSGHACLCGQARSLLYMPVIKPRDSLAARHSLNLLGPQIQ